MAAHDDANCNTVDRMFVGLRPRRGGAMRQRVGTNVLELFDRRRRPRSNVPRLPTHRDQQTKTAAA
jgi:hypothetical protein